MNNLTPEEEKEILNGAPVGTWALMLALGAMMFVGWFAMYYLRFIPHGPLS